MSNVIQCLIDWFGSYPNDDKPCRILKALANESKGLSKLAEDRWRVTGEEIVVAANENPKDSPNKWINWEKTVLPYWELNEKKIIKFARNRGLDSYPKPHRYKSKGGSGKKTTYWINSVPLPELTDEIDTDETTSCLVNQNIIDYELTPHGEVKLSWIAKWFFHNGELRLTYRQRMGIIVSLIVIGGLPVLMSYVSWLSFLIPKQITTREIALIPIILAFPFVVWVWVVTPCMRLFEDRIVLAYELIMAFKEKPAQLELLRDGDLSFIRLVRYSAPCPICGATIYLEKGEPDFPRRLVGRCYDSPREHIFSFDRVTQKGMVLRGAELITPSKRND